MLKAKDGGFQMKLKFQGAHSIESKTTKCATLLVDDIISIDAGALCYNLSFEEQHKIKYIFLTHQHYDHIKDLPILGFNNIFKGQVETYALPFVISVLKENIFTDKVWLDLTKVPPDIPRVKFHEIEIKKEILVEDYKVIPIQTNHSFASCGYYFEKNGKSFFYSGDTGEMSEDIWQNISPAIIILEVTLPNKLVDLCVQTKHLCPLLLLKEVEKFKKYKGYIPKIITTHIHPDFEEEIKKELMLLNLNIHLAKEGEEIIL